MLLFDAAIHAWPPQELKQAMPPNSLRHIVPFIWRGNIPGIYFALTLLLQFSTFLGFSGTSCLQVSASSLTMGW